MKTHPKKSKSTLSKFKGHSVTNYCPDPDLERVAEELVQRAKSRLPNGVMTGHLHGQEDDVRQEAVLLALTWYIKKRCDGPDGGLDEWNPAQAIGASLKYTKLALIKRNGAEQRARVAWAEEVKRQDEISGWNADEWSPVEIRVVLRKAILEALKRGRISHANASIAIQVYVDCVPARELAVHLNRTPGAIHQQLTRVRQAIPEIIRSMRE